MSTVSGGGSCEVATSVICLNVSQLALRKFHRLTGLHAIGAARHGEEISDGRCCDRGNLSMQHSPRRYAGVRSMGECKVRVGV